MCLHKYGKWSEPKTERFTLTNQFTGKSFDGSEEVQYKKCLKCGKVKKRIVEE
jgi:hypothetical protein